MRRHVVRFAFVGIALLLPAGVAGQDVFIGFKSGVMRAWSQIDGTKADALSGFSGGGVLEIGFSGVLSFQTELLVSQKGYDGDSVGEGRRLSYLEMPVLFKLEIPRDGPTIRPFLVGGIAASLELGCSVRVVAADALTDKCRDLGIDTPILDFGPVIGGGLVIGSELLHFTFEGRYTVGMTDIDSTSGSEAFNRGLSFLFGLKYHVYEPW